MTKLYKPVPCENCITLAICKSVFNTEDEDPPIYIADLSQVVIVNIVNKCSLIKEYITGKQYVIKNGELAYTFDVYDDARVLRFIEFLTYE